MKHTTVKVFFEDSASVFTNVGPWHVDDLGYLYIRGRDGGNVAAFAKGLWHSVSSVPDAGVQPTQS